MLFFYFLAAMSDSTGWMFFWSILGMFASSRPSRFFFLPLFAAATQDPGLGVIIVLLTWVYLAFNPLAATPTTLQSVPEPHQPAKPGA